MIKNRNIKNLCATTIICLFALFYVSITMSWHSHDINGVAVSHSHIYNESHHSTPDGEHSTQELILINQANSLLATEAIVPQPMEIFLPENSVEQNRLPVQHILPEDQINIGLRAPPVSMI